MTAHQESRQSREFLSNRSARCASQLVAALLTTSFLAGCGSQGDSAFGGDSILPSSSSESTLSVGGFAGEFRRCAVRAFKISDGEISTSTVAEKEMTEGCLGSLVVRNYAGPVLLEMTGVYRDEAAGKLLILSSEDQTVLRAVVPSIAKSRAIYITPLTELAFRKANSMGLDVASIRIANREMSEFLGMRDADILSIKPTIVTESVSEGSKYGRIYGDMLAAISQWSLRKAIDLSDMPTVALDRLEMDMMDGRMGIYASALQEAWEIFTESDRFRISERCMEGGIERPEGCDTEESDHFFRWLVTPALVPVGIAHRDMSVQGEQTSFFGKAESENSVFNERQPESDLKYTPNWELIENGQCGSQAVHVGKDLYFPAEYFLKKGLRVRDTDAGDPVEGPPMIETYSEVNCVLRFSAIGPEGRVGSAVKRVRVLPKSTPKMLAIASFTRRHGPYAHSSSKWIEQSVLYPESGFPERVVMFGAKAYLNAHSTIFPDASTVGRSFSWKVAKVSDASRIYDASRVTISDPSSPVTAFSIAGDLESGRPVTVQFVLTVSDKNGNTDSDQLNVFVIPEHYVPPKIESFFMTGLFLHNGRRFERLKFEDGPGKDGSFREKDELRLAWYVRRDAGPKNMVNGPVVLDNRKIAPIISSVAVNFRGFNQPDEKMYYDYLPEVYINDFEPKENVFHFWKKIPPGIQNKEVLFRMTVTPSTHTSVKGQLNQGVRSFVISVDSVPPSLDTKKDLIVSTVSSDTKLYRADVIYFAVHFDEPVQLSHDSVLKFNLIDPDAENAQKSSVIASISPAEADEYSKVHVFSAALSDNNFESGTINDLAALRLNAVFEDVAGNKTEVKDFSLDSLLNGSHNYGVTDIRQAKGPEEVQALPLQPTKFHPFGKVATSMSNSFFIDFNQKVKLNRNGANILVQNAGFISDRFVLDVNDDSAVYVGDSQDVADGDSKRLVLNLSGITHGETYFIVIPFGVLLDENGDEYAGIHDLKWKFTTQSSRNAFVMTSSGNVDASKKIEVFQRDNNGQWPEEGDTYFTDKEFEVLDVLPGSEVRVTTRLWDFTESFEDHGPQLQMSAIVEPDGMYGSGNLLDVNIFTHLAAGRIKQLISLGNETPYVRCLLPDGSCSRMRKGVNISPDEIARIYESPMSLETAVPRAVNEVKKLFNLRLRSEGDADEAVTETSLSSLNMKSGNGPSRIDNANLLFTTAAFLKGHSSTAQERSTLQQALDDLRDDFARNGKIDGDPGRDWSELTLLSPHTNGGRLTYFKMVLAGREITMPDILKPLALGDRSRYPDAFDLARSDYAFPHWSESDRFRSSVLGSGMEKGSPYLPLPETEVVQTIRPSWVVNGFVAETTNTINVFQGNDLQFPFKDARIVSSATHAIERIKDPLDTFAKWSITKFLGTRNPAIWTRIDNDGYPVHVPPGFQFERLWWYILSPIINHPDEPFPYPENMTWSCVRDNRTGLLWEVKQPYRYLEQEEYGNMSALTALGQDKGNFRDSRWSYFWYNDDPMSSSIKGVKKIDSYVYRAPVPICWDSKAQQVRSGRPLNRRSTATDLVTDQCTTQTFVEEVNKEGLCGVRDWRLPTADELRALIYRDTWLGAVVPKRYMRNPYAKGYRYDDPYEGVTFYPLGGRTGSDKGENLGVNMPSAINEDFFPFTRDDLAMWHTYPYRYWDMNEPAMYPFNPPRATYMFWTSTVDTPLRNGNYYARTVDFFTGFEAVAPRDDVAGIQNQTDRYFHPAAHRVRLVRGAPIEAVPHVSPRGYGVDRDLHCVYSEDVHGALGSKAYNDIIKRPRHASIERFLLHKTGGQTDEGKEILHSEHLSVIDMKTGLMWKKCIEGLHGADCGEAEIEPGVISRGPSVFALKWFENDQWKVPPSAVDGYDQPIGLRDAYNLTKKTEITGYDGFFDWRLPAYNESASITEYKCAMPALDLVAFPNHPVQLDHQPKYFAPMWTKDPFSHVRNRSFVARKTSRHPYRVLPFNLLGETECTSPAWDSVDSPLCDFTYYARVFWTYAQIVNDYNFAWSTIKWDLIGQREGAILHHDDKPHPVLDPDAPDGIGWKDPRDTGQHPSSIPEYRRAAARFVRTVKLGDIMKSNLIKPSDPYTNEISYWHQPGNYSIAPGMLDDPNASGAYVEEGNRLQVFSSTTPNAYFTAFPFNADKKAFPEVLTVPRFRAGGLTPP